MVQKADDGSSAVLVSYNIQIGRGMDQVYRLSRTADALSRTGAETIVLNEVDVGTERSNGDDQAAYLAERLHMNYVFGRASDRPGGIYGNAVLSVHKIEKIDLFELPPAAGLESRSALVVKILAPRPYYVLAAHFTHKQNPETETVRVQSADAVAKYLQEKKLFPAVLCGDLNAKHDSPTVRRLQEHGFRIVDDLSGKALTYPADHPRTLLDYFCLYPADAAAIRDFRVIDEPLASDHRPIRTELVFSAPEN